MATAPVIISVGPKGPRGSRIVTMNDAGIVTCVVRYTDGTYEHLSEFGVPLVATLPDERTLSMREIAAAAAIAGSDLREAQMRASL